jgi:hypothetical protein
MVKEVPLWKRIELSCKDGNATVSEDSLWPNYFSHLFGNDMSHATLGLVATTSLEITGFALINGISGNCVSEIADEDDLRVE